MALVILTISEIPSPLIMPQSDLDVANYLGEAAEFLVMFLVEVFQPKIVNGEVLSTPYQFQLGFVWHFPQDSVL